MEALERPYEPREGRCHAILPDGSRCANAAEPGEEYCGLPDHQALADLPVDEVVGNGAVTEDDVTDPVVEAGGGVSEGAELTEQQLVENIEGAPEADLTPDAFQEEPEPPGPPEDEDDSALDEGR
jgi:transcription termination/antitermination protein NusA